MGALERLKERRARTPIEGEYNTREIARAIGVTATTAARIVESEVAAGRWEYVGERAARRSGRMVPHYREAI